MAQETPRVGEYYVDYSSLTPEEADAPEDPAITALYNSSKPVSLDTPSPPDERK